MLPHAAQQLWQCHVHSFAKSMFTCQDALPPADRLHRAATPERTLKPALALAAGALPRARRRRSGCCYYCWRDRPKTWRRCCCCRGRLRSRPLALRLLAWLPLALLLLLLPRCRALC